MLRLTELLGADVRTGSGARVGELLDLTVTIGEGHPQVHRLAIGRHRRVATYVDWSTVAVFADDMVELSGSEATVAAPEPNLHAHELLLRRDVLDTQVVDIAGKRLARVSEVLLARDDTGVRVVAVEVGAAGVWRRLGLRRLAARTEEQAVDWADLHLTSDRGHSLQLDAAASGLHRLEGPELAALVAHLPTSKAAAVLDVVTPERAAHALRASHPRVGARLLRAMSKHRAASAVERMPADDATAKLHHLLAHPAGTAWDAMKVRFAERRHFGRMRR